MRATRFASDCSKLGGKSSAAVSTDHRTRKMRQCRLPIANGRYLLRSFQILRNGTPASMSR
jgi:hypothetical protein